MYHLIGSIGDLNEFAKKDKGLRKMLKQGGLLAPIGQAVGKRAKGGISEVAKTIETVKASDLQDVSDEDLDTIEAELDAEEASIEGMEARVGYLDTPRGNMGRMGPGWFGTEGDAFPGQVGAATRRRDVNVQEEDPEFRDVQGAGGWDYRQFEDGSIEILAAPTSGKRAVGMTLTEGSAWEAITEEIGEFPEEEEEAPRPGAARRAGTWITKKAQTAGETVTKFSRRISEPRESTTAGIGEEWETLRGGAHAYDSGVDASEQGRAGAFSDSPGTLIGQIGRNGRFHPKC